MIDYSASGMAYNRYDNLDSIEDRIIYYLISPLNKTTEELKQVHVIWRLLYYNDYDALKKPLPKYSDIVRLIYNDNGPQDAYRLFRSPRLEDGWTEQCSLLKIYVDSIQPTNHISSVVNVGIDVVSNVKIINVGVPEDEIDRFIDIVDGEPIRVQSKSRVTMLTKAVLSLLNGANVQGIGKLVFSKQQSIFNEAQYGLWSNRNYEGIKLVMGTSMSGVS